MRKKKIQIERKYNLTPESVRFDALIGSPMGEMQYCDGIVYEKNWDEILEEMCSEVDKFSEEELTPGTPTHTFQQEMIKNVKRYRDSKNEVVSIASKLIDKHSESLKNLSGK